ncbi:tyrosine-type recombinase/integrase [Polaribacter aquimarinus]|uniref:Recombinase n=1 Tax=Polaribacter aquimarinus TaxID=2100726 RepID=A0A2U2JF63_9FLAO|nr:tyrosine-type recombinase/integrase [Polaribacter aquimarinus]PWG06901.1 recombinase [Polaribacter aquimarinus]
MKSITLLRNTHKGINVITIHFPFSEEVKNHLNILPEVFWSKTLKCFYIEDSLYNRSLLYKHIRLKNWFVNYNKLKKRLTPHLEENYKLELPILSNKLTIELSEFKKWLQQKRLSANTVNTYVEVTSFFLRYGLLKKIENYSIKLIEQFNYDFIFRANKSVSYQNQCINGIKKFLLFKGVEVDLLNIERPKKEKQLPAVLSTEEIKTIFNNLTNLKHKTLLSLLYSGGLRIGEALNLKINDIDSKRMLIHIRQAKGKKDRYTLLSYSFLKLVREYYLAYKPKVFLFEGQNGKKYSNSSAQAVLKKSLKNTRISKKVTLHTLRHTFATHLLENGTDIRYIQELLGHNSPKTTMIYTHVSKTSLKNIKNPFDEL